MKNLISGLIQGVGFSISIAVVLILALDPLLEKIHQSSFDFYDEKQKSGESFMKNYDSEEGKLVIENEKNERFKDGIIITGVLKNTDEIKWSGINLELELFDKQGNFVHECSEYISQTIEPGMSENFKVTCKGCKKTNIPEFATWKLKVVNAHSY